MYGFDRVVAVGLGTLVGPSQVGARILEITFGRKTHPLWSLLASTIFVACGLLMLWAGFRLPAFALIIYGMGNGISSVVRGTVPLRLFGSKCYPQLVGKLALPILLAMAAAPESGALLIGRARSSGAYSFISIVALANVALAALLLSECRDVLRH